MKAQNLYYLIIVALILISCNSNSGGQSETDSLSISGDDLIVIKDQVVDFIATKEDSLKFSNIMNYAKDKELKTRKLSEIEIEVAKQLLEIPYVVATLEEDEDERLVINLTGLDCTTFLENVFAIAYSIKMDNTSFGDYRNILTNIRYRNGIIDKYPSRLHYFTDWLLDNEKKGIIKIISNDFGNADFNPSVGFMSQNPDKYKKLSDNPTFIELIKKQEDSINKSKLKYITKDQLEAYTDKIKDGDLIAFSTTIKGLDISHVVIAAFHNKQLHFYHASSSKKKVVLSEKTMSEYLAGMKKNDGILVARIID